MSAQRRDRGSRPREFWCNDDSERVRIETQELIGSVRVVEEGEHIIAEIDGGRLLKLDAAPDVTLGAQERT